MVTVVSMKITANTKIYAFNWRLRCFGASRERTRGVRLEQAKMNAETSGRYAGNEKLMIGALAERSSSRQIRDDWAAVNGPDDISSFPQHG
jgi:hypothetical protein